MIQLELPYEKPYKYVMDTSVLIDMQERYNRNVFNSLWRKTEEACNDQTIIFVKASFDELFRYSINLAEWISDFYLHEPTIEEQIFIGQLQADYADLVDWNATRELADPYLIACARQFNLTIVTQEKRNLHKAKIPTVAADFHIRCLSMNAFFMDIGWEF